MYIVDVCICIGIVNLLKNAKKWGLSANIILFYLWAVVFRRQLSRSLLFPSLYLVYRFSWLGYLLNFFCDILLILFTVFDLFRICYTVYYFFQGCSSRISYNFFIHCFFPEIFFSNLLLLVRISCTVFLSLFSRDLFLLLCGWVPILCSHSSSLSS